MQAIPCTEPFVGGLIRRLARSIRRPCQRAGLDVDDIQQELLLVWSVRRSQFTDTRGALTTFAKAVLTRAARSLKRSAEAIKRGRLHEVRSLDADGNCLRRSLAGPDVPPSEVLDRAHLRQRVHSAFLALPPDLRQIAGELRSGRSEREIARRLGCSRQRVELLRKRIREQFEMHGLEDLVRGQEA